jgi:hypothetical protein
MRDTDSDKLDAILPTDSKTPMSAEQRKRLEFLEENQTECMAQLYEAIASGGTVRSFAKEVKIPFVHLMKWARACPERSKLMDQAHEDRLSYYKEAILDEVSGIAEADLGECYDDNGNLKPINQIPERVRRALAEYDMSSSVDDKGNETFKQKIKLTPKLKALELLAREVGLFKEKHEVKHEFKMEDLVGDSFKERK